MSTYVSEHVCKQHHTCEHVCEHVCKHTCEHVCKHTCEHVCKHTCEHVCEHTREHVCKHTCEPTHLARVRAQDQRALLTLRGAAAAVGVGRGVDVDDERVGRAVLAVRSGDCQLTDRERGITTRREELDRQQHKRAGTDTVTHSRSVILHTHTHTHTHTHRAEGRLACEPTILAHVPSVNTLRIDDHTHTHTEQRGDLRVSRRYWRTSPA